ncbi:MAG: undecaprenyl/decaprenyl-phosphate alpha-N-acetylglucosaminyl 1-phosphate transferase [Phycisphaerales bacterium]|nr:undecaprenyl/decaprenyl-phosphate alpha-N-acetylglucosaminyl 1-phosphate transferase [Phycisphaerales bacterium]
MSAPHLNPAATVETATSMVTTTITLLNAYAVIFFVAFIMTLLSTPLVRRFAIAHDIVDHPDGERKAHRFPVAYLGGVAVFFGLMMAIATSYFDIRGASSHFSTVPLSIVVGMCAIMFTGLADDVWGWDPRLKIAGQLTAAAALAIEDIGVRVAEGLLIPLADWVDPWAGSTNLVFEIPLFGQGVLTLDVIYWAGTAIIAIFVLGGCNAANLLDGLDGLLSGVISITAIGLLAISILMVLHPSPDAAGSDLDLGGARIVLCVALLGACLGFLAHNFNPASIFLGDCGSLLLGYLCVVIILMLGEHGQTHLVLAGLIVFAVPIMDTTLAIVRRILSGRSLSSADDQHIHHQLNRALGGVKKAVVALYCLAALFAALGVALAALVTLTEIRVRVLYVITLTVFSFIGAIAVKAARRGQHAAAAAARSTAPPTPDPDRPAVAADPPASPRP